jgi:hypothetical protein
VTDIYDPRDFLGDFKTDLWFPHYRQAVSGPWSVRLVGMLAAPGYWGTSYRISGAVVLAGPGDKGKASWMSTTPSEIESQEIGQAGAHGHTVVLGLGLGWQAANAALKPEVRHVTVVERDPAILALIEDQGVLAQLPPDARDKIEIVMADANFWRPATPVDTLLADIWEKTDGEHRVEDYQRMHANIGARSVYFWGQEVQIWRAAIRRMGPDPALDWPLVRAIIAEDFHLPLIVPDWPDYPQKIVAAGKQALHLMALMK